MTRIALISDMHGNGVAFDAVLDDLAGTRHDGIVCLGDAIQGGPQPAEVVARLRDLACPVVMGNADAFVLDGWSAIPGARLEGGDRGRMDDVRAWTLARLSPDDLAFVRGFVASLERPLAPGRRLIAYHGTPRSYEEIILPDTPEADVRAMLDPRPDAVYAGGHTHVQFVRHLGATFHLNPGSAGFAYRPGQAQGPGFRADPWAEYAVLSADGSRLALEFRRVPFDVDRLIAVYRASGQPHADEWIRRYGGS